MSALLPPNQRMNFMTQITQQQSVLDGLASQNKAKMDQESANVAQTVKQNAQTSANLMSTILQDKKINLYG